MSRAPPVLLRTPGTGRAAEPSHAPLLADETQLGLGNGHHVHPDAARVALPGAAQYRLSLVVYIKSPWFSADGTSLPAQQCSTNAHHGSSASGEAVAGGVRQTVLIANAGEHRNRGTGGNLGAEQRRGFHLRHVNHADGCTPSRFNDELPAAIGTLRHTALIRPRQAQRLAACSRNSAKNACANTDRCTRAESRGLSHQSPSLLASRMRVRS